MYKVLLSITSLLVTSLVAQSQEHSVNWKQPAIGPSLMVHGGTGLIQTPTSRMLNDGEFIASYTDNDQYRFWSVTSQLFPWMQATVRYTDVRTRLFSPVPSFSGDQTLKDKGIDVKFRLIKESHLIPEVSVGMRDFGGTGFFESEFLGLSKQLGPVNFHLNLGWGYLGRNNNISNPFCEVRESFCSRPGGFTGRGGKIDYQKFFKGHTSVFGGIEYQTPWRPLRLKLEYEGNDYSNDRAGILQQDKKWNAGAAYRWNNFDFSLNYQRGNTVGFGVSYAFNLHSIRQAKFDRPPRDITNIENNFSNDEINRTKLAQDLLYQGGFAIEKSHLDTNSITLYGRQTSYSDRNEATQRVGRILASELPESVDTYRLVEMSSSVPLVETVIDVDTFKNHAKYQVIQSNLSSAYTRQDISPTTLENYDPQSTGGFFAGIESFWIQTFGNPEAFYLYQGGLLVNGGYAFNGKSSLAGTIKVNLIENFDRFNFTRDVGISSLPRVRTDVREYVSNRPVTMENLFIHWNDRIAPNIYAQAYAGYLESMYGGVGGEILYTPVDSSLSFGFDINYVRQRSYENNVDFFDYDVVTGHANIYWQPNFIPDTLVTLNIGRYLAKDKGVTIDFAKRFDSGIVLGAYAALTNVSAEEYGEGSFTKGFYMSIPFDLFSLTPSKGQAKIPWVPISRDGGQPLNRPVKLRNITSERSSF
jgi:hypothetical protein